MAIVSGLTGLRPSAEAFADCIGDDGLVARVIASRDPSTDLSQLLADGQLQTEARSSVLIAAYAESHTACLVAADLSQWLQFDGADGLECDDALVATYARNARSTAFGLVPIVVFVDDLHGSLQALAESEAANVLTSGDCSVRQYDLNSLVARGAENTDAMHGLESVLQRLMYPQTLPMVPASRSYARCLMSA